MIWIDYVIIGLVSFGLILGLLRGFNLEVFSLVFWMLALVIGLSFSREFSVFLESTISNLLSKTAASFALLFLITLTVGVCIRMLLGELINKPKLTLVDRFGGMIFGFVHGMFVVMVFVTLAGLTPLPNELWWKESKLLPPFQTVAIWLRDYVPSGLAEYINYR